MRRPLLIAALAASTACRSYVVHTAPPCDGVVWVGGDAAWGDWTLRVTGTYQSNYGDVHLFQDGARVTGWYRCCGGGTIEGTIVGRSLMFEWREPARAGRGVWTLQRPGRLDGSWGWGARDDDGGTWTLAREVDDDLAVR